MQIYLDDQRCELGAESVGQAIAAVADLAEADGRMIVEVHVDGEHWTERELGSPDHANITAEEVRLVSADPVELVSRTFADADEALSAADGLQQEAAELIQADEQRKAMDRLGSALSIWVAVQQAVERGAQLMNVDLDDVRVSEVTAQKTIEDLAEHLRGMRSALEAEDPIQLSDTLRYELPEVVQQWRGLLRELQFRVQRGSS